MKSAVSRKAWRRRYIATLSNLDALRNEIDQLGEDGEMFVFCEPHGPETRTPDQIACYASNSLEGVRSLLADLWQRVIAQGDPNK